MNKLKYTIVLLLCPGIVFFSCTHPEGVSSDSENGKEISVKDYSGIDSLEWLIGEWESFSGEDRVIESWRSLNDSTLWGFVVAGVDTLETIEICQRKNEIFYMPAVSDQNGGKPVAFKLTSERFSLLEFENPEHDYPQKITYVKINQDSVLAFISGVFEKEELVDSFPMHRVK